MNLTLIIYELTLILLITAIMRQSWNSMNRSLKQSQEYKVNELNLMNCGMYLAANKNNNHVYQLLLKSIPSKESHIKIIYNEIDKNFKIHYWLNALKSYRKENSCIHKKTGAVFLHQERNIENLKLANWVFRTYKE